MGEEFREAEKLTPKPPPAGAAKPHGLQSTHIYVPHSKSMLQRALLAAAWAGGETRLIFPCDPGPPGSQGADVADLILSLGALGLGIEPSKGGWVWGLSAPGFASLGSVTVALGESATAARICTAALAFAGRPGSIRSLGVSGTLASRSSQALMATLNTAGCKVQCAGPGSWPLALSSVAMPPELELVDPVSSQEVSALLFALAFEGGGRLTVRGEIPSKPYLEMTLSVLRTFGIGVKRIGGTETHFLLARKEGESLPDADFQRRRVQVECDASSAAVAWSAGLLARTPVCVAGIERDGVQGDVRILDMLAGAGASVIGEGAHAWRVEGALSKGLQVSLADTPDLAPPLAALAAGLALGHFGDPVPSRLSGLGTLDGKESARLEVLCSGLQSIGIQARRGADWLEIPVGSALSDPIVLDAHNDHRMAFAFGLMALVVPTIRVEGRRCVSKSWPGFWEMLASLPSERLEE
ncbi:MAG: hypothetical protein GY930_20600 [bacterium]|nr:hypothetical protein [bacterium]